MALTEVGTIRRSGDDGSYAESWLKINNTLVQSVEILWSAASSVSRRQMYINFLYTWFFFARFFLFLGWLGQNLTVFDQGCPPRSLAPPRPPSGRGTVALVAGRSAGTVALVVLCRDCVTAPCCLNFPFISCAQRGFIYSPPITHCWLHAASRLRSIKINQGRAVVSGPLAFFNCGYEKLLFFFFHFYLYRYYLTILVVVTVPSL